MIYKSLIRLTRQLDAVHQEQDPRDLAGLK